MATGTLRNGKNYCQSTSEEMGKIKDTLTIPLNQNEVNYEKHQFELSPVRICKFIIRERKLFVLHFFKIFSDKEWSNKSQLCVICNSNLPYFETIII